MKIIIDYESAWRNSFLDGSNDAPLPKKGRNFVASMTELKKEVNYQERSITKNTVLGVLSRLIGDQRKLYQARESEKYYFLDIEDNISFQDNPSCISQEITYIRNIKGSTDQNSFTGMIKVKDPAFNSDYSKEFWGVLELDIDQLCDFILNDTLVEIQMDFNPISILRRLEKIKKEKPFEPTLQITTVSDKVSEIFDKFIPKNNKGLQLLLPLYCSALYIQLERLEKKYEMTTVKSARGGISGISNNGFTPKDFMRAYTTGSGKLIYGNPYIREEYIKGEGKIKHTLTKASGQLEIFIDINLDKAKELKNMIDCAGVSSFYLGKKGLAYVSSISVR